MANRTTERVNRKKQEILETAKEVFIRRGRQTRMIDIAERTGMDKSSLYYYFKGIPEVLNALLRDKYRDLHVYEQELIERDLSSVEILREMLQYLLEFYLANFEIVQIILYHTTPLFHDPEHEDDTEAINEFLAAHRRADKILLTYTERAQASGELGAGRDPRATLSMIRGAMLGVVASWKENRPDKSDIPDYVRDILKMFAT